MWEKIKLVLRNIVDIGVLVICVAAIAQVLLGGTIFGIDVIGTASRLLGNIGTSGIVGLMALAVIVWLAKRK